MDQFVRLPRRRLPLLAGSAFAVVTMFVAGCATKAPPPPPPPVAVVIPPKPMPPQGAPPQMTIPPVDASGQRQTVNSGISSSQAVWNLRSAYNVAALNCIEARYNPILEGYKRFLTVYAKPLDAANKEIDASFRSLHAGRAAIVARETYQTQVYNFFSLPPVDTGFCQAAMELTNELMTVDPSQFVAYSFVGLAKMEAPFKAFFEAYERYRSDLAAWESRYGNNGIIVRPKAEQLAAQVARSTTPEQLAAASAYLRTQQAAATAPAQPVARAPAQTGYAAPVAAAPTGPAVTLPPPAPTVSLQKPATNFVSQPVTQPVGGVIPAAPRPSITLPQEAASSDQPRIVLEPLTDAQPALSSPSVSAMPPEQQSYGR